jgi:hypothetical protein
MPSVAPGSVAAVPPPLSPARLTLQPSASVTLNDRIVALSPAGGGVAFATTGTHACGARSFWQPGSSRLRSVPGDCGDADSIDGFAAAPGLIVWTYLEDTLSLHYAALLAGMPGRAAHELLVANGDQGANLGNLYGDGSLVVFQSWPSKSATTKLWRVVGGRDLRLELLARKPAATRILAVDSGRILLQQGARKLMLLDAHARPLRSLPPLAPPNDIVLLAGNEIAVQRKRQLSVYDARTAKLRFRTKLAGEPSYLESARGNLIAYASGVTLHILRLRTGVDRVVTLPGSSELPRAAFSSRGLFVSYAAAGKAAPGRLMLVPLTQLAK